MIVRREGDCYVVEAKALLRFMQVGAYVYPYLNLVVDAEGKLKLLEILENTDARYKPFDVIMRIPDSKTVEHSSIVRRRIARYKALLMGRIKDK